MRSGEPSQAVRSVQRGGGSTPTERRTTHDLDKSRGARRQVDTRPRAGGPAVGPQRVRPASGLQLGHKDQATGEWTERPHYFDVNVYGPPGETVATYLRRGRLVAIDGRLSWREWETADEQKRQAVSIVADTVQFLDGARDGDGDEQPMVGAAVGEDDLTL